MVNAQQIHDIDIEITIIFDLKVKTIDKKVKRVHLNSVQKSKSEVIPVIDHNRLIKMKLNETFWVLWLMKRALSPVRCPPVLIVSGQNPITCP